MQKNKVKLGYQDKDDPTISTECIEEFCNKILDSPELYPYFMELRPSGLWRKCNKLATYITFVLNKNILTPADTEFLKKIHHRLNIKEADYDEFTRLFAHICCRNKSDFLRKRMLSMFSLLKAHVCPLAGSRQNLRTFLQVMSNIDPVDWKEDENKGQDCSWLDRFPAPADNCFLKSKRSVIWNEQAQYVHLRKRLRKCERLTTVIQNRTESMEIRIAKLEEDSRKDQVLRKQQRDLDLVYN